MFPANLRPVVAGAGLVLLLGQSHVRADYITANVPLTSQVVGQNVGNVLVEANSGSTAINGLSSGQARLTFTVAPVSAYTQNGPTVGFTNVLFYTNLPIAPSQITGPAGWSVLPPVFPQSGVSGMPPYTGPNPWEVVAPNDAGRASKVSVLISGLGSSATVDHFLTPPSTNVPPPIFQGTVKYDGSGNSPVLTDNVVSSSAGTAPEPSTLALGAVSLAGVAFVRRWRTNARR